MINALEAAKTFCEASNWSLSNLKLQKLLYIAHMFALGRSNGNAPLLRDDFEAWDYGPVVPEVYRRAKVFGSKPVGNIFHLIGSAPEGPDRDIIQECYDGLGHKSASHLVAITHWEEGAWARNYTPGVKGLNIPDHDILQEYRIRESQPAQPVAH